MCSSTSTTARSMRPGRPAPGTAGIHCGTARDPGGASRTANPSPRSASFRRLAERSRPPPSGDVDAAVPGLEQGVNSKGDEAQRDDPEQPRPVRLPRECIERLADAPGLARVVLPCGLDEE